MNIISLRSFEWKKLTRIPKLAQALVAVKNWSRMAVRGCIGEEDSYNYFKALYLKYYEKQKIHPALKIIAVTSGLIMLTA